jgi:hypothetical protein
MTPKTALPTLIGLTTAIALLTPAAALAITGFTGVYDPSNFTFTPTPSGAGVPGNDLVTTGAAAGTVTLFSPDDSSNGLGNTAATSDWTIPITPDRAGTISFDWSYEPFDPGIGDDSAFYLLNGTPFPLATNDGTFNPQSSTSTTSLTVADGDTFGFRVSTESNGGGPGAFSVSNFDFTPATPVPFESDALPFLVGLSFLGAGVWLKRRHQTVKTLDLSPTEGSEVD